MLDLIYNDLLGFPIGSFSQYLVYELSLLVKQREAQSCWKSEVRLGVVKENGAYLQSVTWCQINTKTDQGRDGER